MNTGVARVSPEESSQSTDACRSGHDHPEAMTVTTRSPDDETRTRVLPRTSHGPVVSGGERSRRTAELFAAALAADDPASRSTFLDEVILLNRCVAEAIANRYRGRGVPSEDLQQSAFEGLVKAVRRFDPSIRSEFLLFAVPTIRGEVQRWFRDQGWMVRPPRRLQEMQWRVSREIETLATQLGHEPTIDELAAHLQCPVEDVDEALRAFGCFRPASLDHNLTRVGRGARPGLVPDASESECSAVEARVTLAPVVRHLSERDRQIIYLRFFEQRSRREIGAVLGVTTGHVSRLLRRILTDLKEHLTTEQPKFAPEWSPARPHVL